MEPSQTPGWLALSNAFTVAPGRCTPKGEYPLVFTPPPESNTFWLSTMSWHGMSCCFWPSPVSRPTTPLLVVDPCDQEIQPALKASCTAGWSPDGRPVMN